MKIDGSWYNVYTYLWDEIVPVDGETALGLQTIKMNPKVDYDPVSDSYKLVVGGEVTDVDYDLVNGKVYVNAFAIQTELDGFLYEIVAGAQMKSLPTGITDGNVLVRQSNSRFSSLTHNFSPFCFLFTFRRR